MLPTIGPTVKPQQSLLVEMEEILEMGLPTKRSFTKISPEHDSQSTLDTEFSLESTSPLSCIIKRIEPSDFSLSLLLEDDKKEGFSSEPQPRRSSLRKANAAANQATRRSVRVISNFLPGQSEVTHKNCCIAFDEVVRVKHISPIRELVGDCTNLWYQSDELERIRNKTHLLVYKVKHDLTKGKNYCVRGLEAQLQFDERQSTKLASVQSVLEEQDVQILSDQFDEMEIARTYHSTSFQSKKEAHRRALLDERDVRYFLGSLGSSLSTQIDR